jgi:photosystem II stability/assembly factor-like uncharacterized protein
VQSGIWETAAHAASAWSASAPQGAPALVRLARSAVGYACRTGGPILLATGDGLGWKPIGAQPFWQYGSPRIVGVCAASAKAVWLAASTGEVFASEEGGLTWRVGNPDPAPAIPHANGAGSYEATICVFGSDKSNQAAAILSTDSGRTWLSMGLATATGAKPFGVNAVAFASAKTFWLVDVAGQIFRTLDGGTTWQKQR